jgi:hypothetical protein
MLCDCQTRNNEGENSDQRCVVLSWRSVLMGALEVYTAIATPEAIVLALLVAEHWSL